MMRTVTTGLILLSILVPSAAFAAIQLPQASPSTVLSQGVGVSKVTLSYHRPGVKGRKIWGDLVPLGKVWRLGANNATTIELSHEAKIDGHTVPAGTYGFFAIPAENEWTLILNKQPKQWGAYFYDEKLDLLRWKVKPQTGEHTEWFEIGLAPTGERALRAEVRWERVRVPFTIEFDTDAIVWKNIETELASPTANWESWHNAARYAWQTNTRLNDALVWIDKALATESFWNYEMKANILQKLGRTEEAYPLMEKAKALATGKAPKEYIEGLDREVARWRAGGK